MDRHIRDKILGLYPLHLNQFTYQSGKYTETALHNVVTHTEDAVEHREIARGAFLHMEAALDRTLFQVIIKLLNSMRLGTKFVGESAPCWVAVTLQSHWQEKL